MFQHQYVEDALASLEKSLGLHLTIIDNDGLFNYKQQTAVFNSTRRSHQVNPVCRAGFCDKCIQNCRYRINHLFQSQAKASYSVCWKGLGQLAIPMRAANFHYGILYAGMFRDPDHTPPKGLPDVFYREYDKLAVCPQEQRNALIPVLHLFAEGLITYLREENIINDEYDFRIRKISQFIHEHYRKNIGLPDISACLGVSESYASALVKRLYGHTFSYILHTTRIEYVKKKLITTEDNLHKIARDCGFQNEFYLSKVFKDVTGESPSVFRKKSRPNS